MNNRTGEQTKPTKNMQFRYEELEVNSVILKFIDEVYVLIFKFPPNERYALAMQIQRAVVSVFLNIAEGSARRRKDFARFVRYSMGSLLEVHAGLKIALRRSYITQAEWNSLQDLFQEIWFKLWSLRESQNDLSDKEKTIKSEQAEHVNI